MLEESCPTCSSAGEFSFDRNFSLFYYEGMAKEIFLKYKFKAHKSYHKVVAYFISKYFQKDLPTFDVIVPLTLSREELFEREFCPVSMVVSEVGKKLNLKFLKCIKRKKVKNILAQHKRNLLERKKDIDKKYFFVNKFAPQLTDKRVLIIDDVFTTGATVNAIAKMLLTANQGIKSVSVFTFFRGVLED